MERIKKVLFCDRIVNVTAGNTDGPNIRYSVLPVFSKSRELIRLTRACQGCCVIFCMSRVAAETNARVVLRHLTKREAFFYHAGLNREERARIESWFAGSEDGVLCATSAYGMGVDKPDIRAVIHLDVPYSPEAYLQETGRAGRDGAPAEATLLCSAEDLEFGDSFAAADTSSEESPEIRTPSLLAAERYDQMLGYAKDSTRCRREQLLQFLAQEAVSCSGCDVCDGQVQDQPEGAEKIVEVVSRHRRRFTVRQLVKLLLGTRSYTAVRQSLASYGDFGLLTGWEEEEIEEALESLRRIGAIRVLKRGPWKDRVTMGEAAALELRS
jgi:ATP-dependent DNA helicase RecQ